jgi:hypothetical protein
MSFKIFFPKPRALGKSFGKFHLFRMKLHFRPSIPHPQRHFTVLIIWTHSASPAFSSVTELGQNGVRSRVCVASSPSFLCARFRAQVPLLAVVAVGKSSKRRQMTVVPTAANRPLRMCNSVLMCCSTVFIKCRIAVSTRWCSGWDSASSHKGTDSDLIHAYRTYLSRLSRTPGDDDDDDLVQDS